MTLPKEYSIEVLEAFEEPAFSELTKTVLGRLGVVELRAMLPDDDEAVAARGASLKQATLRLGLMHEGAMVGWSFSFQQQRDTLFTASSGVLAEHRRHGLYTALTTTVVEWARERGYHDVRSSHMATNNPVLIAKLKLGFRITGMRMSAPMGTLLDMELPLHPLHAELLDVRAGMRRADGILAERLVDAPREP